MEIRCPKCQSDAISKAITQTTINHCLNCDSLFYDYQAEIEKLEHGLREAIAMLNRWKFDVYDLNASMVSLVSDTERFIAIAAATLRGGE